MNSHKFNVVKINSGDSSLSSRIKIMLIASMVAEKDATKVQDYEKEISFLMNRENQSMKY